MYKKISIGLIVASIIATPLLASAHERQLINIGGTDYIFTIGSLGEPVVVDDKTGIDLRVKVADPKDPTNANAAGAKPVEGLEKTLKVELISGSKKKTFDLSSVYGQAGSYKNTFFPTDASPLTYRVFGTFNDTPIDISFSCNIAGHVMTGAMSEDTTTVPLGTGVVRKFKAGQFGCPSAKEGFGFPDDQMSIHGLHNDLAGEMDEAIAGVMKEQDKNQTGAVLAFGILGTILGVVAIRRSRKM